MHKASSGLSCSFCGKAQEEVFCLIAGPTQYICDECVSLCNDIIAEIRIDATFNKVLATLKEQHAEFRAGAIQTSTTDSWVELQLGERWARIQFRDPKFGVSNFSGATKVGPPGDMQEHIGEISGDENQHNELVTKLVAEVNKILLGTS